MVIRFDPAQNDTFYTQKKLLMNDKYLGYEGHLQLRTLI